MRAAPDVILIGEIRDRESMQAAINLSGTGHLVLATLHANNCAETLDRIINMFPLDQHKQVTLDLSQYLRADPRAAAGDGRRRQARGGDGSHAQHAAYLRAGRSAAMSPASRNRSCAAATTALSASTPPCTGSYKDGRISLEEALAHADSRSNLEAKINFG